MDRLWAPWRSKYLKTLNEPLDNFITAADAAGDDREWLVVTRSEKAIVILNRYPYSNGHLLVAPRRQVSEVTEMTDEEHLDVQKTLAAMLPALKQVVGNEGFNIGLNIGRVGGAGLPKHLHWHIVPRWHGDVNFMTVIADTKVIPQSLDELWLQLRKVLKLPTE